MNKRPTPEADSKARYPGVCDCYKHDDSGLYVDIYFAQRLELERDEAREYVKELHIEMDGLFDHISFLQDALRNARDQYRLSSVCRELKAENERLKQQQQP